MTVPLRARLGICCTREGRVGKTSHQFPWHRDMIVMVHNMVPDRCHGGHGTPTPGCGCAKQDDFP